MTNVYNCKDYINMTCSIQLWSPHPIGRNLRKSGRVRVMAHPTGAGRKQQGLAELQPQPC